MIEIIFVSLFLVILGVLFVFMGYALFRFLLPLWGFIAGFSFAATGVAALLGGGFLGTISGWIVGFIFGIILAIVSYAIYSVGIALVGATLGAYLVSALLVGLGVQPGGLLFMILFVVAAIFFGAVTMALRAQKYLVIVLSAFAGSSALIMGVLVLFGRITITGIKYADPMQGVLEDSFFWSTVWIMIAFIGILIQTVATRGIEDLDMSNYDLPGIDAIDSESK